MLTLFATVRAFLGKLPWWTYAILASLAVVWLAYRMGYGAAEDKAEVKAAQDSLDAVTTAREADSASGVAIDNTRSTVEQGNVEARNAANGGDDPLGDGLRSLRGDAPRSGPAAR